MITKEELLQNLKRSDLPYLNLNKDKTKYMGWVSDFGLCLGSDGTGEPVKLNLNDENDLFLLFVLASAWSRTGKWENAAYFTAYLKLSDNFSIEKWKSIDYVDKECANRQKTSSDIFEQVNWNQKIQNYQKNHNIKPRKPGFRSDYYQSVYILANIWNQIKELLATCVKTGQWDEFILFFRKNEATKGLGGKGQGRMLIKLPLLLREIKCANIYPNANIPGEYCCVPDKRVKDAAQALLIKGLSSITCESNLLEQSKIIYDWFGELYDIPLFAYKDIMNKSL